MKKIIQNTGLVILLALARTALGQSPIVITEIFYNQPGNDTLEYVELYNNSTAPVNLNGYSFTQGVSYTFGNYTLASHQYVVVARYSQYVNSFYNITAQQWTSGSLDNNGEKIVLKDPSGKIADSVEYENNYPWDPNANGSGNLGTSLTLCNPNSDNALGYNWKASEAFVGMFMLGGTGVPIFGTPGSGEACTPPGDVYPPRVRKAKTQTAATIGIRFDEPVNLSTSQNSANYQIAGYTGTITAKRSALDSVTLTLTPPLQNGIVDTLYISGIADTNAVPNTMSSSKKQVISYNNTIADLVITEIMYDNNGPDTLEFVEVFNRGTAPANVGGYEFNNGITFRFPSMMTIDPGQYVAIPKYQNIFNAFFGMSVTYDFSGTLDNAGENLSIENTAGDLIDSVRYVPAWHPLTNPGASLVLCNPLLDNDYDTNWGASGDYKGKLLGQYDVWASPGQAGTSCITGLLPASGKGPSFTVYPNPAKETINISFINSTPREIKILDGFGRVLFNISKDDILVSINLPVTPGMYYLQVKDLRENKMENSKIIIE